MTFLQGHITRHLQMKVRFHRWNEILESPEPPADLPHARAMWDYAQGRALAATGDIAGAKTHLERLKEVASNPEVADLRLEFNTSGAILGIAARVLEGQIAAAEHDYDAAIEHLKVAAFLEDELVYGEPPEWSVPVRQELGFVQLNAGRPADAEQTFREDLARFPDNGWSLYGLAKSLEDQGQEMDAKEAAAKFEAMWASADVEIEAM
jgi:tetratricopeptide (TPR) repeat protein